MLYDALAIIKDELNNHLNLEFGLQEDQVVLGELLDNSGAVPKKNENKLVLSLLQIEEENSLSGQFPASRSADGDIISAKPQALNLEVLVSSLFTDYSEALRMLSTTLSFFQGRPFFNAVEISNFPQELERLSVEMVRLSYADRYHLWKALGSRQRPFLLFRFRLLTYEEHMVLREISAINQNA
jgi:hypothetical protein